MKKRKKKNLSLVPHAGGRPTVMNQDKLRKLEYAFSIGCSVAEALGYANLAKSTFYDFCKDNPELSDRFEHLREQPVLKARQTLINKLGRVEEAKWYLGKRRPEEFGEQSNPSVMVPVQVNLNEERKKYK